MEEIEDPTEQLKEKIYEIAEEQKVNWFFHVALSTAVMAVFAAISGLIGGDHANEAMMAEIKAANQWSYYQAKGIKSEIATATNSIKATDTGAAHTELVQKIARYESEKEQIRKNAELYEKESEHHLSIHKVLAKAVTMFQVAIAISAVSIIARRRVLWVFGILLAVVGIGFLVQGLIL